MATRVNMKDIGWMYHSPAKKEDRPEVRVPPTSQIPLLGNMPDEMLPPEKEPMQGYIKDTDTPYIVLAKTGGRKDLLRFKENKPAADDDEAKNYPRCDWFYLEDSQLEAEQAAEGRQPWVFRLPDYMVHNPWNPTGKRPVAPKYAPNERGKPPFATEQDVPNHMVRFDKRNRLPEVRKQGYGVRTKKMEAKGAESKPKQSELMVDARPTGEADLKKKARRGFQDPAEASSHERPSMDKLLSMGYAKDWAESHDAYEKEKADAARAQAEKLRNLQARIQARETQQQRQGYKLAEANSGQHCGVSTKPWKPTTKAGDLL